MTDFLKIEEKLIKEELRLVRLYNQTEMLSKVSNAITLITSVMKEKIVCNIKSCESLSLDGKLKLPLKIKGKMLGVGRYKIRFYTEEELKLAVERFNTKMPCKLDHRTEEVASTIGAIDKLVWDNSGKVIRYEGHVNDETQARNVLDGVVTQVSATIISRPEIDAVLGIVGKDLEFDELSFVKRGAYEDNSLEAVL